ncbi:ComEC/Rec2 family competence protein [Tenacibaculum xiamenense]|uniref:ComEC/Rec2 family competence protein n=1 Tax=Tenacibaculum xiamenense TaxID=1261553 RepID=UPI003893AEB3
MKKLLEYLPFYMVVSLIIGIYLNHKLVHLHISISKILIVVIFLVILLFLSKRSSNNKYFPPILITSFICIGYLTAHIKNPKNHYNYYKNYNSKNKVITIQIKEKLKSTKFHQKYIGKIIAISNFSSTGNILLSIEKKYSQTLNIDQLIVAKPDFKSISPPLNPYQFDYRNYLAKQYVYEQVFLRKGEFEVIEKQKHTLKGIAENIRIKLEESLENQPFSKKALSIMKALLLGQRKEISKETLTSYTDAGVIHILAISGLHLGILLIFINFILKPLQYFIYGEHIRIIIVILILWGFAFISGLSPSVTRSATMFSFITLANLFHRKTFSEHSIISSMFILLLINPMNLYNVGFQLSYLAVFGIIWIYPLLFNLWNPRYLIIKKVWQLSIVSISAQIAVLPLSIYYFHQFPLLFLISNLVIVSLLGFILISGMLIILFAVSNTLPRFIVSAYDFIIIQMNTFVEWMASFEQFVLHEISLNQTQTIIWYLIIIAGIKSLYKFNKKTTFFALISFIILQFLFIHEKKTISTKNSLVVFHKSRETIIGKQRGKNMTIYNKIQDSNLDYIISPFKKNESLDITLEKRVPDILRHKENILFIMKNDDFSMIKGLKGNLIILLSNSPKINLNRVLINNNPKMVIADGSNYKSFIQKWEEACRKQKTPFYSTEKNGAYILN